MRVNCNLVDSFTVPCTALTAGICLRLGLYNETVTGVWKTVGIPTCHVSPWCNVALGNPNLYLDQPSVIAANWRPRLIPHWQPIATRLGLFSSLTTGARGNVALDLASSGPIYNVFTAPEDFLAHNVARPSADTLLAVKLQMSVLFEFILAWLFSGWQWMHTNYSSIFPCDVWEILRKSRYWSIPTVKPLV